MKYTSNNPAKVFPASSLEQFERAEDMILNKLFKKFIRSAAKEKKYKHFQLHNFDVRMN